MNCYLPSLTRKDQEDVRVELVQELETLQELKGHNELFDCHSLHVPQVGLLRNDDHVASLLSLHGGSAPTVKEQRQLAEALTTPDVAHQLGLSLDLVELFVLEGDIHAALALHHNVAVACRLVLSDDFGVRQEALHVDFPRKSY